MKNILLLIAFVFSASLYSQDSIEFEALVYVENQGDDMVELGDLSYKVSVEVAENYFVFDGEKHYQTDAGMEDDVYTAINTDPDSYAMLAIDFSDGTGLYSTIRGDLVMLHIFRITLD